MTFVGLDLSATRARAVVGGVDGPPTPLPLDEAGEDLPLAVGLGGRRPEVGRPATAHCREYPHLVCLDFLAYLGSERRWAAGRHRLDAAAALGLVFERLQPALAGARAVVLALPAYLSAAQASQAVALGRRARLPVVGSVAGALAAGRTAYDRQPWTGPAVLVDVDDHALTWAVLEAGPEQLQVLSRKTLPQLNLRAWKTRLLDALADLCIRHSRRDPRDSASAEQLLYDQLDDVFAACAREQLVEVVIRASRWCQNLILHPRQVRAFCERLAGEAVEHAGAAFPETPGGGPLVLTAAAERLPGLAAALADAAGGGTPVVVLPEDAAARTALALAAAAGRGGPPAEHLSRAVPLPPRNQPASTVKRVTPRLFADH